MGRANEMNDIIGSLITIAFAIVLSVVGIGGFLMIIGFKLIEALKDLNKTLKEKPQSEDCGDTYKKE